MFSVIKIDSNVLIFTEHIHFFSLTMFFSVRTFPNRESKLFSVSLLKSRFAWKPNREMLLFYKY